MRSRCWWLTALLLLAGCGGNSSSYTSATERALKVDRRYSGGYPIKAVCTTGMVADLVRHVGGELVQVDQLFGPEVDPHTHKPTTAEVSRVSRADLIFYNGLHLEGKMGEVFERLGRKIPTFAVAEFLPPSKILQDEEKAHDPHVWFDVSLWSDAAGIVCEVLSQYDATNAAAYKANAARYQSELADLHEYARKQIASIQPRERRVLVTSHDAFHYFGRAYDIEVKAIQGISTESEASVKDIADLVRFISERRVAAVFVETTVNKGYMQALVEGCGAKGHTIRIGGELFSDAMGKEGTPEGTYIGMVRHNVETIVKALR